MSLRRALAAASLTLLVAPAAASGQSPPFAPWDGTNPFNCVLQDVGTGTDYPDPEADPFCVKFDKTNQNVTDFGIVEFAAQEPARVAAASPKCFYFQHDEWTGSVVQGQQPELWHWDGRYFFDKAKGIGGVSVRAFRIGGRPQDATPYVPPEYRPYFDETGGGGVISTLESGSDPRCAQMADADEERETIYSNQPDFGDCVPPRGKVRARKVGAARLGAKRRKVREKVGAPQRTDGRTDRWCVIGGGRLRVLYEQGRAGMIRTTTPGHSARGAGPGDRAAKARHEADLRRRARWDRGRTDVYEAPRRHGRQLLFGIRDRRVRWLALIEPNRLD
jgi:hypothetical protein